MIYLWFIFLFLLSQIFKFLWWSYVSFILKNKHFLKAARNFEVPILFLIALWKYEPYAINCPCLGTRSDKPMYVYTHETITSHNNKHIHHPSKSPCAFSQRCLYSYSVPSRHSLCSCTPHLSLRPSESAFVEYERRKLYSSLVSTAIKATPMTLPRRNRPGLRGRE